MKEKRIRSEGFGRAGAMRTVRVGSILLSLVLFCAGCASYVFEGYPQTRSGMAPRLRYRVEKVAIRYGKDVLRQYSTEGVVMSNGDFCRLRPDVFGDDRKCVPLTVTLSVCDFKPSSVLFSGICSVLTITLIPMWQEWRSAYEVSVSLAGDDVLAQQGRIELQDAIWASFYTPSALIVRPSPADGCEIHDGNAKIASLSKMFQDVDIVKRNRSVLFRSIVEEVVGVLGRMEKERLK